MKTRLVIEIETPDANNLKIINEDYYDDNGECDEKKMNEYKIEFSKDLHAFAIKQVDRFVSDVFEEEFMDNLEELSIENWEEMSDYGVKISMFKK